MAACTWRSLVILSPTECVRIEIVSIRQTKRKTVCIGFVILNEVLLLCQSSGFIAAAAARVTKWRVKIIFFVVYVRMS